jgi:hypothetical protein
MITKPDEQEKQELFTLKQIQTSKEIVQVKKGMDEYIQTENVLKVIDQATYDQAGDFCKKIKIASKKIEDKRKFFVDPYNYVVKQINAIFKDKTTDLDNLERRVKNKMMTWYDQEQRKREAELLKIQQQNQRKIEKAVEKQEANPEKVILPPVLKSEPAPIAKTSAGSFSKNTVRAVWKWEVEKEADIPREYLTTNDKKISDLVRAGLRTIPGIRIYQEKDISIR